MVVRTQQFARISAGVGRAIVVVALLGIVAGCGRGVRVLEVSPQQQSGGGTVTGMVLAADSKLPLGDRIVEAVNVAAQTRHTALTTNAGGYTLKLPPGRYRFDVRLEPGEVLAKQPPEMVVEVGEIETRVDFAVAGAARGQ
jgi:hypothetical protein